jgi:hypothetical protein
MFRRMGPLRRRLTFVGGFAGAILLVLFANATVAEAATVNGNPVRLTFRGTCHAIAFINADALGYVYGQGGSTCTANALHSVYFTLNPLGGPRTSKVCIGVANCQTGQVSVRNPGGLQRYCGFAEVYYEGSQLKYSKALVCANF